ncbi:hypothetical protein [Halomonas rhizosphaerae]|uniref:Transposase n=1 Tax=Halomonas rhizosphaerae TaxID=3043296 RepID=A0ABT6V1N9_9GAMM|nr:hypothetical protein [Halomonas rhizosphaerae]MDI5892140.1 hypothetical protein [Halomonas rhizosphaerae]MDI5920413.1 hypothetical protein [Halomonas rhizosphaerae]
MTKKTRRRFSDEFKADVVSLVILNSSNKRSTCGIQPQEDRHLELV